MATPRSDSGEGLELKAPKRKARKHLFFCWVITQAPSKAAHYKHTPLSFSRLWCPEITNPNHPKHTAWRSCYDSLKQYPNNSLFRKNFFTLLDVPPTIYLKNLSIKMESCPLFPYEGTDEDYHSLDEEEGLSSLVEKVKKTKIPKSENLVKKLEQHEQVLKAVKLSSKSPSSTSVQVHPIPVSSSGSAAPESPQPSGSAVSRRSPSRSPSPAPLTPGAGIYSEDSDDNDPANFSPPHQSSRSKRRRDKAGGKKGLLKKKRSKLMKYFRKMDKLKDQMQAIEEESSSESGSSTESDS